MTDRDTLHENTNTLKTSTDLSETFDVLSHPERRAILQYFDKSGAETADMGELVDFVTDRMDETDEDLVRLSLNQHHLPRLADAGFIDYDPRSGAVRCRNTVSKLLELFSK